MRKVGSAYFLKRGLVFSGLFFFSVGVGLVGIRFHSVRLAYHLESVNKSIERYSVEEAGLRQEFSGLVAPIKVYSYCKEMLGMEKVAKVESISSRISNAQLASEPAAKPSVWRASLAWIFNIIN